MTSSTISSPKYTNNSKIVLEISKITSTLSSIKKGRTISKILWKSLTYKKLLPTCRRSLRKKNNGFGRNLETVKNTLAYKITIRVKKK